MVEKKQNGSVPTMLKVIKTQKKYIIGMSCLSPNGTIEFRTTMDILGFRIKWENYSLFDEEIVIGEIININPINGFGRYYFGIEGQKGFPFFIEVCNDLIHSENAIFCLYRKKPNVLDLRISIMVPLWDQRVLFRADPEFEGVAKLVEIPTYDFIGDISLAKPNLVWQPAFGNSGSTIVKVEPASGQEVGGGNEAEIEIEPPDDHESSRQKSELKK